MHHTYDHKTQGWRLAVDWDSDEVHWIGQIYQQNDVTKKLNLYLKIDHRKLCDINWITHVTPTNSMSNAPYMSIQIYKEWWFTKATWWKLLPCHILLIKRRNHRSKKNSTYHKCVVIHVDNSRTIQIEILRLLHSYCSKKLVAEEDENIFFHIKTYRSRSVCMYEQYSSLNNPKLARILLQNC